ncbi:MAG: sulfate ABC transporter substrate-binding protein [Alkalinema sp. RU_4_3]|nr:sulfate ABC transporter substrate-binding protein [Alkalinema sp. RU_4_3]
MGYRNFRHLVGWQAGLLVLAMVGGCSSAGGGGQPDVELTLVSFAVTKSAHDAIIPKFVEKWQREKGQRVRFKQSYGGSGSQTRAVVDGLKADVVHLALGSDVAKIEQSGLIQPGWEQELPNGAIVSKSVAAIVRRDGNPKGIQDWADLAKPNIKWITADPKTSGVARWNFLALWQSAVKAGFDDAKALEFVGKAYGNVPILTKDAREATDVFFKQGQGDALVNYENEVLFAQSKGTKVDYVVPKVNISIDNPIAVVDKNVDAKGTREVAEAFTQYLFSPEAQAEFAKVGFRPVDATVANNPENQSKYPKIDALATVKNFKGWPEIQKKFFADGAAFDQIQAQKK